VDDRQLWTALVSAEQERARRRVDFYRDAQSRAEILGQALNGSAWDRGTALNFLRTLPDDVPTLLDRLVDHALTHTWALEARQAIAQAPRDQIQPRLRGIVAAMLPAAEDDEYRRLAELLAHLEHWSTLHELVEQAMTHDDPDIREVGEDFTEWYAPMWVRPA
jgi:hypothetical protein